MGQNEKELKLYLNDYSVMHPEFSAKKIHGIFDELWGTKELKRILLGVNPNSYRACSSVVSNLIMAFKYSNIHNLEAWNILIDFLINNIRTVNYYSDSFYHSGLDVETLIEDSMNEIYELNQNMPSDITTGMNLSMMNPKPLLEWVRDNADYAIQQTSIWILIRILVQSQTIDKGRAAVTQLLIDLLPYDQALA